MTQPHAGLDRRRFLQLGATAALGLAAGCRLAFADDKDDPFGGFTARRPELHLPPLRPRTALKHLKDLDLHYVEFYQKHVPGRFHAGTARRRPEAVQGIRGHAAGLGRADLHQGHGQEPQVFRAGQGARPEDAHADPDPDSFDSLDKLCDEYKIAIGIHPHGPQGDHLHRWYSAEVILPAVKDHNALIGTCLDTGHLIRAAQLGKKLDPVEEVRKMGARNFGIHLKDWNNDTKLGSDRRPGQPGRAGPAQGAARREVPGHDQHRVRGQGRGADRRRAGGHPGRQGRREEARLSGQGRGERPVHRSHSDVCVPSAHRTYPPLCNDFTMETNAMSMSSSRRRFLRLGAAAAWAWPLGRRSPSRTTRTIPSAASCWASRATPTAIHRSSRR